MVAEEPLLDPTTEAILNARREGYIRLRDETDDPEERLHFHLMAGFSDVAGRAMFAQALGMDWDNIFRAYFGCCVKLMAEAIINCSENEGEVIFEDALAEQFAASVRRAISTKKSCGEVQIGHG